MRGGVRRCPDSRVFVEDVSSLARVMGNRGVPHDVDLDVDRLELAVAFARVDVRVPHPCCRR